MTTSGEPGDLTVVVIGLNAAPTLAACLGSIREAVAALGRPAPILYVDGGSRDGSPGIARAMGAEVIQLVTDRPTAAKGRNAGWRAATTPLVQFVDSDTTLEPGWLRHATREIGRDPRIAVLFGQLHEANPTGSVFNEVCGHDWYVPPGDWRMCGGNALFRREALVEVDGSDEALAAGEEADLCWRLRRRGWRIVCVEALMAHHDLAMKGFRDYWRRAVRSGTAYAEVGARFAGTDDPMWLRETLTHLLLLPAALALAAVGWRLAGGWALAALAALVAARLAWKFRELRGLIPGARQRVRYLAHLTFVRLPLFVGAWRHVLRTRPRGAKVDPGGTRDVGARQREG
jgi:GT2 family glycosyltransferase